MTVSGNEKAFVVTAAVAGQRVDGRRPFDARRLALKLGPRDGVAEVSLGRTRILASVTATLGAPFPDRPNEGQVQFMVEISPMGDPAWEAGRPLEAAMEVTRALERSLRESGAVDAEALCVLAGRAAWQLKVLVHVLDHDGALLDACTLAALAALLALRLPATAVGGEAGDEVQVLPAAVKEPVPLNVHHLPLALTFVFFDDGDLLVLDPLSKEEAAATSALTVHVNQHNELCGVSKVGGTALPPAQILRCVRIALSKLPERVSHLQGVLVQYESERVTRRIRRLRKGAANQAEGIPLKMDLPMTVQGADLDSEEEESSSEDEEEEEVGDDDVAMNEEEVLVNSKVMAKVESSSSALGNWREMRPPKSDLNKDQLKQHNDLEATSGKCISGMQEEDHEPMDLTAAIKLHPGAKRKGKSSISDSAV